MQALVIEPPTVDASRPPSTTVTPPFIADDVAAPAPTLRPAPPPSTTLTVASELPGPVTIQAPNRLVGYSHPEIWFLPLLLLVLVPIVARAITKELDPPAPAQVPPPGAGERSR